VLPGYFLVFALLVLVTGMPVRILTAAERPPKVLIGASSGGAEVPIDGIGTSTNASELHAIVPTASGGPDGNSYVFVYNAETDAIIYNIDYDFDYDYDFDFSDVRSTGTPLTLGSDQMSGVIPLRFGCPMCLPTPPRIVAACGCVVPAQR